LSKAHIKSQFWDYLYRSENPANSVWNWLLCRNNFKRIDSKRL